MDYRAACCTAAKVALQTHGLGFVYLTRDGERRPTGLASGVLVRLKDEHFIFTAGHNLDEKAIGVEAIDFVSANRNSSLSLNVLGGISIDTKEIDAAVLKVAPKADDDLSDIALPGKRVWPAKPDSQQLADGYITVSGFPGTGFRQTGPTEIVLHGHAWMTVRAGCDDSATCPRTPEPWTADVWLGVDDYASDENILVSHPVPPLKGVSGGPYWLNAEEQIEPGLIAVHRESIDAVTETGDPERFARGQLVSVHLRLAAELSPVVADAVRASHPWILDIDPYVGTRSYGAR